MTQKEPFKKVVSRFFDQPIDAPMGSKKSPPIIYSSYFNSEDQDIPIPPSNKAAAHTHKSAFDGIDVESYIASGSGVPEEVFHWSGVGEWASEKRQREEDHRTGDEMNERRLNAVRCSSTADTAEGILPDGGTECENTEDLFESWPDLDDDIVHEKVAPPAPSSVPDQFDSFPNAGARRNVKILPQRTESERVDAFYDFLPPYATKPPRQRVLMIDRSLSRKEELQNQIDDTAIMTFLQLLAAATGTHESAFYKKTTNLFDDTLPYARDRPIQQPVPPRGIRSPGTPGAGVMFEPPTPVNVVPVNRIRRRNGMALVRVAERPEVRSIIEIEGFVLGTLVSIADMLSHRRAELSVLTWENYAQDPVARTPFATAAGAQMSYVNSNKPGRSTFNNTPQLHSMMRNDAVRTILNLPFDKRTLSFSYKTPSWPQMNSAYNFDAGPGGLYERMGRRRVMFE